MNCGKIPTIDPLLPNDQEAGLQLPRPVSVECARVAWPYVWGVEPGENHAQTSLL
jgi:hypothetical protein